MMNAAVHPHAGAAPVPQPHLAFPVPGTLLGTAAIVRMMEDGQDLAPVWDALVARLDADPADAAALMDISTILLLRKARRKGLEAQREALCLRRDYRISHGRGGGLRLLAFVTAGDLMANTPLDFLLAGSDMELILVFVDAATTTLRHVPPHDIAFIGVGESPENQAVLANLSRLTAHWPVPVVNGDPRRIAALTRDGVAAMFADAPDVLAPAVLRVLRATLQQVADGECTAAAALPGISFPVIVRPIGSHAGVGLEKVETPGRLALYLPAQPEAEFFVSPFIDYSGPDGLFCKQRIAFIDGAAFASHAAMSPNWMIHYVNAGMRTHAERRAREAQWMDGFESDFARRHKGAFAALHRRIGLDYFAIDCAELPDGRLLLFEVDVAMVVHDADSAALFPYKKPAMHRLFAAFQQAIAARAEPPRLTARG